MTILPLTSDPYRTFATYVNGTQYQVTTRWNEVSSTWTMDIDDPSTGLSLVASMPLVLGADLLKGFAPELGSMLVLDSAADPGYGTDAGPEDLGARVQVCWLAPGEVL